VAFLCFVEIGAFWQFALFYWQFKIVKIGAMKNFLEGAHMITNQTLFRSNKMKLPGSKVNKFRWIKLGFALISFAIIFYWRVQILEFITIIGDREAIVNFLQPYGFLGPLVLFIILMLQVFIAVIPGHAFIVAGGYIYGLFWGVLITQLSTVIASQLAFLLVRRYGRPMVDRFASINVDRWNQLAEKQGGWFFFFAFILPIFPNDLMAFVAGLSAISSKKFFAANFFGRLPVAIVITLIGSHGFQLPIYFWLVIALTILGLCVFWKYFSTQIEKRFLSTMSSSKCAI